MFDHRVLTVIVLNLGSQDTGGDAILEDPTTEIPMIDLYASLGRLRETLMEATALFLYAEVGRPKSTRRPAQENNWSACLRSMNVV
jgi:hypothetical protein